MRVKFSIQMNPKRRSNSVAMTSPPVKNLIYESPHKLYVGNLAWTVQPQELRDQFSQFGHVTSARVVHDRKAGKTRTYGFLSFASAAERDSAKSLNGEASPYIKEFLSISIIIRLLTITIRFTHAVTVNSHRSVTYMVENRQLNLFLLCYLCY